MIEEKVKLIEVLKEDKGKRVVGIAFHKYYEAYEHYPNKNENDIKENKDLLMDYMRYMSKSGFK